MFKLYFIKKRLQSICLLFLLAATFTFPAAAQKSEVVFRHFTPKDGLPSSEIYQVLQDKNGFLWFASDHGIAKYNGYEFKLFTSANGLSDNTVFKLFLDARQRVWMQTFSGKLFYIENDKIISYQYNSKITAIVQNNIPQGFYVDSLENVWFSCGFVGEFNIDIHGQVRQLYSFRYNSEVSRIYFDEMDTSHFLTSGNSIFDPGKPLHFFLHFKNNKEISIAHPENWKGQATFYQTISGTKLLSFSKYLYALQDTNLVLLREFSANITHISEAGHGQLLVSTYKGFYICSERNQQEEYKSYLSKEFITGSLEDHEGGIWITTLNNGVFYLNATPINNYFFNDTVYTEPLCLSTDKHFIYAGFWNGKIIQATSKTYSCTYHSPDKEYITHLFSDTLSQKMYVAKNDPGYFIGNRFIPFKGKGSKSLKGNFLLRKNGDLLNATANGIYKIEKDSFFAIHGLQQRTNCIFETSKQELLLGCNSGVYVLNNETGETRLLHPALNAVRVDDIKEINGVLCFASRGEGLILYYNNSLKFIHAADGLCNNIIHRLAVSGNNIWCASYNGLSKIKILQFAPLQYELSTVGIQEGLPSNEINDLLLLNDTLWVASKTALSFFNQEEDFSNKTPPILHFTSFIINNVEESNPTADLPATSNNISIGYEALSFKSSGAIIYNYTLIHGSDTFSSRTTERRVEFLALKPGQYLFNVSARNSSGTWSEKPIAITFTIAAPFWQQWWFTALLLFVLLLIFYMIIRSRINRIKKQESLKTDFNKQIMQLEIKALRAQMNPHFIFNVINSIQDYILKNDALSAQRYLTKFAKLVRLILDNSAEGEVLLSEELKANELYVELEQQRFDEKFKFTFEVEEDVDTQSIVIPSMIIQPFLENAIKHGIRHLKHPGQLHLKVTQNNTHLIILIEDNGVGRTAAAIWNTDHLSEHVSRGSFITEKRVEAFNKIHHTKIEMKCTDLIDEKNQPAGTSIELRIPVRYRSPKTE